MSKSLFLIIWAMSLAVVHAEEITFVASGQVTWMTPGAETLGGLLANPVHVGDEARFYYTFESATAGRQPYPAPTYVIYEAIRDVRVEVAGNVWAFVPCRNCAHSILVQDDYPNPVPYRDFVDVYQVTAVEFDVPPYYGILLQLASHRSDPPVPGLASTALPLTPPDRAAFQEAFLALHATGMQIEIGKVTALAPEQADTDSDGVEDRLDNCPWTYNPDQMDTDADGKGDLCDGDDDNDGVLDGSDNCRLVPNSDQANADGDALGDTCDGDIDGDGFENATDNCPLAANPDQTDTDHDRVGDECDANDDNDAHPDVSDNCPAVANDGQQDLDQDGIGDVCDEDLDGDGIENVGDNCPIDTNRSQDDTDRDGAGDACDDDDDADTVLDGADNCPLIPNSGQADADGDGAGDVCDADLDGDSVANDRDNCPTVANSGQADFDSDGIGDACDDDVDGDGISNTADTCAFTVRTARANSEGCTIAQLCPCDGPSGTVMPWRNHGKYVSCVAQMANRFLAEGLISASEHGGLVSAAAQSACGGTR